MITIDYYMTLTYPIVVKESTYTDGSLCYEAEHPDLPGCRGQGDSTDEAIENIHDARYLYIESLLEDGLPVPPPSDPLPTVFRLNVTIGSTSEIGTSYIISGSTETEQSDAIVFPDPSEIRHMEQYASFSQ
jgi:antitoxin HicB